MPKLHCYAASSLTNWIAFIAWNCLVCLFKRYAYGLKLQTTVIFCIWHELWNPPPPKFFSKYFSTNLNIFHSTSLPQDPLETESVRKGSSCSPVFSSSSNQKEQTVNLDIHTRRFWKVFWMQRKKIDLTLIKSVPLFLGYHFSLYSFKIFDYIQTLYSAGLEMSYEVTVKPLWRWVTLKCAKTFQNS